MLLMDAFLTILLLSYIRYTARIFSKSEVGRIRREAKRGNALVVGTDADSVARGSRIISDGVYNLVGYLTRDKSMAGFVIGDVPVYFCDGPDDLAQLEWKLGGVDCVFFPQGYGTQTPDQVKDKNDKNDDAHGGDGNPGQAGAEGQGKESDIPMQDGMSRMEQIVKRSFDFVLSLILVIVFFPVGLLCALAIKIGDGGPVLYRQERIGRNGRPFTILKFRSMRTDAEAGGAQLWSGEEDPRLTKVGAFLRRHHLDELPQLLNVLRGDMSFIGYRPERACYIEQIVAHNPRYRYLYQIRPGVTSYATLYNGYTDSLEKMLLRLDLDLYYLRNHSLRFDARVLGLTFLSIVSGKEF
jgi:lipopolysaccharide/colanic/teichoic acid biosynthesis glycosyltransferase